MSGNPFAGTARIGWMEFWSHLKSLRLIVLVILLALLVFGASYGLSQSPYVGLSPLLDLAVHPGIRNESGTVHYLVIGWLADQRGVPRAGIGVSVYRQGDFGPPTSPYGMLVENLTTNATGFVVYDSGTTQDQNVSYGMLYLPYSFGTAGFYPGLLNRTFTVGRMMSSGYSGPGGSGSFFSLHVMTLDGYPGTGVNISVDGNLSDHPNENGFFVTPIGEGQHVVEVSYLNYSETYPAIGVTQGGPVFQNGADYVLILLAGLLQLVVPIMSIAISFDAIARERAQGSLELLLARRVRREGILAGKFLGAFASVAIPTVGVLLGGIALVTALSGRSPTGGFAATTLGGVLFLIAVYVLLMLLFSSLAKSVGTAVVFGVVTWLIFSLLFSFLAFLLLFTLGGRVFDPGFYTTLLTIYLFDPNTLFQLMLGATVPTTGGQGSVGIVPTGYISIPAIIVAAVLWIAIPLALTVLVFRKKAEG